MHAIEGHNGVAVDLLSVVKDVYRVNSVKVALHTLDGDDSADTQVRQAAYVVTASCCLEGSSSGCPAGSTCLLGLCRRWGGCCLQEAGPCGGLTQRAAGGLRQIMLCADWLGRIRLLLGRHTAARAVHAASDTACAVRAEHVMEYAAVRRKHCGSHGTLLQVHAGSTSLQPQNLPKARIAV